MKDRAQRNIYLIEINRVLKYVEIFLKHALKIGWNARYGHKETAKLLCESLAYKKSLSRTAIDNNIYHTTLCRRVSKTDGEKIGRGIEKIATKLVRSGYSIIDYTHLKYFGKSLLSYTYGKKGFKIIVVKRGGVATFLSLYRHLMGRKEETEIIENAVELSRGCIVIADGEFSCKKWISKLIEAYRGKVIAGFIVRANSSWHKFLNEDMPINTPIPVDVLGYRLYAWRTKVKNRSGVKTAYYLSTRNVSFREYAYRWRIEILFRGAKSIMPKICLRDVYARLLVFAVCLIVSSILFNRGLSIEKWRSSFHIHLSLKNFAYILAIIILYIYYIIKLRMAQYA